MSSFLRLFATLPPVCNFSIATFISYYFLHTVGRFMFHLWFLTSLASQPVNQFLGTLENHIKIMRSLLPIYICDMGETKENFPLLINKYLFLQWVWWNWGSWGQLFVYLWSCLWEWLTHVSSFSCFFRFWRKWWKRFPLFIILLCFCRNYITFCCKLMGN